MKRGVKKKPSASGVTELDKLGLKMRNTGACITLGKAQKCQVALNALGAGATMDDAVFIATALIDSLKAQTITLETLKAEKDKLVQRFRGGSTGSKEEACSIDARRRNRAQNR